MNKCEFYQDGYCIHDYSITEQEEKETAWECDGSEESQKECGCEHITKGSI